mmetsp:Transcript_48884/g.104356  ORF Transcript_48884/g.104356 Transcript_48884/m.104356 type:complete len:200 (+) Transcript_48884:680-1279(+)
MFDINFKRPKAAAARTSLVATAGSVFPLWRLLFARPLTGSRLRLARTVEECRLRLAAAAALASAPSVCALLTMSTLSLTPRGVVAHMRCPPAPSPDAWQMNVALEKCGAPNEPMSPSHGCTKSSSSPCAFLPENSTWLRPSTHGVLGTTKRWLCQARSSVARPSGCDRTVTCVKSTEKPHFEQRHVAKSRPFKFSKRKS